MHICYFFTGFRMKFCHTCSAKEKECKDKSTHAHVSQENNETCLQTVQNLKQKKLDAVDIVKGIYILVKD